ncbi:LysR substrate-binding domain-containing protein [Salinisphaera sp. Q1T1-3]|uniref:LysR substrate-binding domain-containing protein n=1 Tax=Salinisphaera sp. Q1T1-3 TaxID=2321229 RepID=UPI000E75E3F1|nr:LysR substrate-binding domain-containing protein [Salinisphaera sp. Q1T1-3]RJS94624.1 LysR family transcriptional regulator [Salinisphaera sp. Q1T1-3]
MHYIPVAVACCLLNNEPRLLAIISCVMDSLPPYHGLRVLLEVAKTQSIREAARGLKRSESSISHQIRSLERRLGETLLEKHGRGIQLTPIALSYARLLAPSFNSIDEAAARLNRTPNASSGVSLTLSPSLATLWLIPRLGEIEALEPDISLRLATTMRILNLERDEIDIAIRYRSNSDSAERHPAGFSEHAFPVCAPAVAQSPSEFWAYMKSGRVIGNEAHPDDWSRWQSKEHDGTARIEPTTRMADSTMTLEAAAQGHGVAIGRLPLVSRMLRDGRLVAPIGTNATSGGRYVVATRSSATDVSVFRVADLLERFLKEDCEI